jgi:hypothetical protein
MASAMDSPNFSLAVEQCMSVKPDDFRDYLMYDGQWHGNKANGRGLQNIWQEDHHRHRKTDDKHTGWKKVATYDGEFSNGKRHGRGTFTSTEPGHVWIYYPVDDEDVDNWQFDMMDGRGVLETANCIHENIIFRENKACMPWVQSGPPLTSFDDTPVIGSVLKMTKRSVKGIGAKKTIQPKTGETQLDVELEQPVPTHIRAEEQADFAFGTPREVPLVREDTEKLFADLEIQIRGGTGGNDVLNGFYFRRLNTYGLPQYEFRFKEHTRMDASGSGSRWLYRIEDLKKWIIGPYKQEQLPVPPEPGWAFFNGSSAKTIEDLRPNRPFHVYWPRTQNWSRFKVNKEHPVDHVTARCVVGFTVSARSHTYAQFSGLYRRRAEDPLKKAQPSAGGTGSCSCLFGPMIHFFRSSMR